MIPLPPPQGSDPPAPGAPQPSAGFGEVLARLGAIEQRLTRLESTAVRGMASALREPLAPIRTPAPPMAVPQAPPAVAAPPSVPTATLGEWSRVGLRRKPVPPPRWAASAEVPPQAPAQASVPEFEVAAVTAPEPPAAHEPETWAHVTNAPATGWGQARPWWARPTFPEVSAGRILALAGGAALVLGAVFFLSLAFSRGWIGAEARVILGLVGGLVLLVLSPITFDRRQPTLAHVLAAAGVATLELALYASRLYELAAPELAMLATVLVAAAATVIAVRFDSQVVAVLGLAAVLISPPLMQAPATLVTAGFLAVMVMASTAVALARAWRWLSWLALVATAPQLVFWMWRDQPSAILIALGVTVYWLSIAAAAVGEMWLRQRPRLLGSSAYLLLAVTGISMLAAIGFRSAWQMGLWLLLLGGLQAAGAAWFLLKRSRSDDPGQLLATLAFGVAGLGFLLAAPAWLIPVAWAAEAALLATFSHRLRHWYASWGAMAFAALVAIDIGWSVYPLSRLMRTAFPPLGEGLLPGLESALTVGSLLAILAVTGRWALTSWSARSGLASLGALLLAYVAPFETRGLVLLLAWTVLSMACLTLPGQDQELVRVDPRSAAREARLSRRIDRDDERAEPQVPAAAWQPAGRGARVHRGPSR